jgi:hypothetical protein
VNKAVFRIEIHHKDLIANWDFAVSGKGPFSIKGLGQSKVASIDSHIMSLAYRQIPWKSFGEG